MSARRPISCTEWTQKTWKLWKRYFYTGAVLELLLSKFRLNLYFFKVDWTKFIAVNGATAHPHYDPDGTSYNMGNSYGRKGQYVTISVHKGNV